MAKPAIKRNKAAARSCVILGTVLAGTAIWFSLPNAAKPASQNSAIVPAISSSAAASTISSTNPVQPKAPPLPHLLPCPPLAVVIRL